MMRKWEIWRREGYANTYLERWGNPTEPIETWEKGQRWRMTRAAELVVGKSVVDAACGLCHLYRLLRGRCDYVGVDNSPAMLDMAKKFFPEVSLLWGDVYDLSFLPKVDTVYALSVLLHLPDPWEIPIQELWDKTKKALVFNTLIDNNDPRLEVMEDGLLYNVSTEQQVLEVVHSLPKVKRVESWLSNADGSRGEEFIFVRCLK